MFSAELAVAKDNRRIADRAQMHLAGAFTIDQASRCLCRIVDLSATGARLELFNDIARDSVIELRLSHGIVRRARIMWVRDLTCGCAFDVALDEEEIDALSEVHDFAERPDPFLSQVGRA